MKTHKDLEIWKLSIEMVKQIYLICQLFPKEELYGLTSQIKRSAISIPSNIAEGAARKSRNEYIQHVYISLGSLSELETQLIIAQELNFIGENKIFNLIEELRRKILNFIKYLKSNR